MKGQPVEHGEARAGLLGDQAAGSKIPQTLPAVNVDIEAGSGDEALGRLAARVGE